MQIAIHRQEGRVLLLSMLMIVVLAGIVAATQIPSSSQTALTSRGADLDTMESTAEGLIGYANAVWKARMTNAVNPLSTTDATALVTGANRPAVPGGMQISSFTITALDKQGLDTAMPDAVPSLSELPKGLQSTTYEYAVRVTLTAGTVAGNRKSVTLQGIVRHDLIPTVGGLTGMKSDFELHKPGPDDDRRLSRSLGWSASSS